MNCKVDVIDIQTNEVMYAINNATNIVLEGNWNAVTSDNLCVSIDPLSCRLYVDSGESAFYAREINPKELINKEVFTKMDNCDILAYKKAEVDKLLLEGTSEEVRNFIHQTRFLMWELNELNYKLLFIDRKPYQPKHMR